MRILKIGLFILGGLLVLSMLKGTWTEIQENRPVPRQSILRAQAEFSDDGQLLQVTNRNDFAWPQPRFMVNGKFQLDFPEVLPAGQTLNLPVDSFSAPSGEVFPGREVFHRLDIFTATMEWNGKS